MNYINSLMVYAKIKLNIKIKDISTAKTLSFKD